MFVLEISMLFLETNIFQWVEHLYKNHLPIKTYMSLASFFVPLPLSTPVPDVPISILNPNYSPRPYPWDPNSKLSLSYISVHFQMDIHTLLIIIYFSFILQTFIIYLGKTHIKKVFF